MDGLVKSEKSTKEQVCTTCVLVRGCVMQEKNAVLNYRLMTHLTNFFVLMPSKGLST